MNWMGKNFILFFFSDFILLKRDKANIIIVKQPHLNTHYNIQKKKKKIWWILSIDQMMGHNMKIKIIQKQLYHFLSRNFCGIECSWIQSKTKQNKQKTLSLKHTSHTRTHSFAGAFSVLLKIDFFVVVAKGVN